jgi:hypothetical protein
MKNKIFVKVSNKIGRKKFIFRLFKYICIKISTIYQHVINEQWTIVAGEDKQEDSETMDNPF